MIQNVPKGAKVAVAMSGGVDSSVTAALLAEEGYEVFGMMLRLWSEPGQEHANRCCTPDAMALARRVASQIGIPFYAIDAKNVFHDKVVQYFLTGYSEGGTPNPCLVCNRHIRWEFLLNRALAMGADYMATGHYARLVRQENEPVKLLRGVDRHKDQSYVLSVLDQEQLQRAIFPVGEYTKPEVRGLAEKFELPAAKVKDSQDLCFLAGTDYPSFLSRYAPNTATPGKIVNQAGEELGEHRGLAFYTIGQRKGLGIAHSEPLYVLAKQPADNTLLVGTTDELGKTELTAESVNWVSGTPETEAFEGEVKIRYTAGFAAGNIIPLEDRRFKVQFKQPARDITPGQAAVAYRGEEAIASGIITDPQTQVSNPFEEIRLVK